MSLSKKHAALESIVSMRDEREYAKVNSRMKLAVKIADALKEKNISQKKFAETLGKKPSEISKWLSGTHNFTHDTLVDIQSILGIELLNTQSCIKMATSEYIVKPIILSLNPSPSYFSGDSGFCQKYDKVGENINPDMSCSKLN